MPRSDVLRSPIPQDLNLALPDGTEVSSQMIAIGEGDIAIQEQVMDLGTIHYQSLTIQSMLKIFSQMLCRHPRRFEGLLKGQKWSSYALVSMVW